MNSEHGMSRARACAGADLDLDLTPRTTDRSELAPTPLRDNSLSNHANANIDRATELERENSWLRDELGRIRHAALVDLQNAQAQNVALGRQLTALKNELIRQDEEDPGHDEVKTLLLHWKHVMGKTKRVDIGAGGKRYRTGKAAIKRWGFERCRNAIDGLAMRQHVGPRGRSADPYPGSQILNDVEYAFGTDKNLDETRLEKCIEAYEGSLRPTLVPVKEWTGQPVAVSPKPPEAKPEPRREWRPLGPDPITRVLACAHQGIVGGAGPGQVKCGSDADTWQCLCPAHEDSQPSLSIRRLPDGKVLLHCFAGCSTENVLYAWGLDWSDLWEGAERDRECDHAISRRDVSRRPGQPGYEPPAPHLVHDLERVLSAWKAAA